MAQKLRKHGKKLEKTSVGCDIDFTILLSMLKVKLWNIETVLMVEKDFSTLGACDRLCCFIMGLPEPSISNCFNQP